MTESLGQGFKGEGEAEHGSKTRGRFLDSHGYERFGEGEGSSGWFSRAVERGREDAGREETAWPVRREGSVLRLGGEKKRKEERGGEVARAHDRWARG